MSGKFKADEKFEGLSNYLSGNAELSNVISNTDIDNLMLIPAGQFPPNPTALLQNSYFNFKIQLQWQNSISIFSLKRYFSLEVLTRLSSVFIKTDFVLTVKRKF